MKEQLVQIRAILEQAEIGGKSGLQCKNNPEGDVKAICDALAKLEADASNDERNLEGEIKEVEAEQKKNDEWKCDCAYAAWAEWDNALALAETQTPGTDLGKSSGNQGTVECHVKKNSYVKARLATKCAAVSIQHYSFTHRNRVMMYDKFQRWTVLW